MKEGDRSRPDPSVYHPHGNRPDPDGGKVLMLTNGDDPTVASSRRWMEDPPLRPKRDPTMYVDGVGDEPSMVFDQYNAEQPDGEVKHMSSMYMGEADVGYVSEQPDGKESRERSMYMGGPDEESQYDQYGFKQSIYMGSSNGAEYARGRRDPSYYVPNQDFDQSFRTEEPNTKQENPSFYSGKVSRKSGKSKKSTKSTKSAKSAKSRTNGPKRSHQSEMRRKEISESLASSWGNVMPEIHSLGGQMSQDSLSIKKKRRSKSFFR